MSYYRESPTKRSPLSRSPAKLLQSERDYIEQEIILKSAYRSQAQSRRLLDQISLLQIRTRKIDQLEARCDALHKQNSLLTIENDNLSKQLSERRYDLERIRSSSAQIQQRDAIKSCQLEDINRSLELQAELLKKERFESNKLYEAHIQKLQLMLEDRIKENDVLSLKVNDLLNEKEIAQIRFEEEKNKLKNLMSRTSYDLERELEYNKDKQTTEKFVEIQTLKKNYTSQIVILQDQISKLKSANAYKSNQFQSQLQENKNLKNRYEEQIRNLLLENDSLRERILKLEQMNRTQVENIQSKYSEIQTKGTLSLKEQHQREIMLLLQEIDRQKWIIQQKNNQIQNLIRQKRQQNNIQRERQLALNSEVDSLKNKLATQQNESTKTLQQLTNKNNDLVNKNLRDSQNYFQRVKGFQTRIKQLQSQVDHKQAEVESEKVAKQNLHRQLAAVIEEVSAHLRKKQLQLIDCKGELAFQIDTNKRNSNSNEAETLQLKKRISELEVLLQNQREGRKADIQDLNNQIQLLKISNQALKQSISALEGKLSQQQQTHSQEMSDLSSNVKDKIQKLQAMNKKLYEELTITHKQEIQTLNLRIEKLEREKGNMEAKLKEYIGIYEGLQTYFEKPHDGALFKEKGSSSIYQVLSKTSKSTIHIF